MDALIDADRAGRLALEQLAASRRRLAAAAR
jgi:hypothetical protein